MSFEADPGVNSRGRDFRHRRQKEKFATQGHTVSRTSKPFSDLCSRAEQSWRLESIILILAAYRRSPPTQLSATPFCAP